MPIDPELQLYLDQLQKRLEEQHGKDCIPSFCSRCSSDISEKKVLAVLQGPGKAGPDRIRECSIFNNDPTSRNQRSIIIDDLEFDPSEILFWNFYPYYFDFDEFLIEPDEKELEQIACAKNLKNLADRLVNLEVMVICGNEARLGMEHFDSNCQIPKVYVPLPSPTGLLQGRERDFRNGWEEVREIIGR